MSHFTLSIFTYQQHFSYQAEDLQAFYILSSRKHFRLLLFTPKKYSFTHKSFHPPTNHSSVRSSVHPSIRPSIHSSVRPSVRSSVRPSLHPFIHPSIGSFHRIHGRTVMHCPRPLKNPELISTPNNGMMAARMLLDCSMFGSVVQWFNGLFQRGKSWKEIKKNLKKHFHRFIKFIRLFKTISTDEYFRVGKRNLFLLA